MADHVRVAPQIGIPALQSLSHVTFQQGGAQTLGFTSERALRLGLNFAGNQHFPLGQATLAVTATGLLNVGNISGIAEMPGNDGVEIPLGRADFCEVASPPLPPGGSLRYEFHAVLDDVPDRVASTLTLTADDAGGALFTADMSPLGATRYTMVVVDAGRKVAVLTNQPVAAAHYDRAQNLGARTVSGSSDKPYIDIRLSKLPGDPDPIITLSSTLAVPGDEVIIRPENAVRSAGPQNRLLITAAGMDSFQVSDEQLGVFGLGHTALGTTRLRADISSLTVEQAGTVFHELGHNGVLCHNGSADAQAILSPLTTPNHPNFQSVMNYRYQFSGINRGSLTFTALAVTNLQIAADFSPLGSSTCTVEVWQGGQLVQSIPGHSGDVGTVSVWPIGLGHRSTGSPTGAPGCTALFGQVVDISISGGPTLEGDELRVYPENPSQPIGIPQTFTLESSGFDSFTIINETTSTTKQK